MCKERPETVQNIFNIRKKVNNARTIDKLPKCETVMLKPEWGSDIRFQIDNGTSVNKIPLSIYHKASKDYQNKYIKTSQMKSIAFWGFKIENQR